MVAPYAYKPLKDEDHIRLLRIDSVSGTKVRCTMRQRRRPHEKSESNHLALSYCWGDESVNSEILINGKPFLVTRNLFNGLRAFHRHKAKFATLWIWIDAVCIDQGNAAEKSSQVRRMDQIYSLAGLVIVWLGEEADDSQCVMKVFQWLYCRIKLREARQIQPRNVIWLTKALREAAFRTLERDLERITSELMREHDISKASLKGFAEFLEGMKGGVPQPEQVEFLLGRERIHNAIFPPSHAWWRHFLLLTNRPWFYRVWTLQEIRLASNAMVICGDYCVNWNIVQECRACVLVNTVLVEQRLVYETLGIRGVLRSAISNLHLRNIENKGIENLRVFLIGVPGREAKDPRDFVYGYLGMLDNGIKSSFTVNYKFAADLVFKEAIIHACKPEGGAEYWAELMEEYVCTPKTRVPGLPSWCPDLSEKPEDLFAAAFLPYPHEEMDQVVLRVQLNRPFSVMDDMSHVQIFGAILDTVVSSTSVATSGTQFLEYESDIWTADAAPLQSLKSWLDEVHLMLSEVEDKTALTDSWLQNYFYQVNPTPNAGKFYNLEELRELCEIFQLSVVKTVREAADLFEETGVSKQHAEGFVMDMLVGINYSRARSYFVTKSGKIGFAPKQTTPGQQICYFPGGKYLQVLSPEYDEYFTSASVDGYMGVALLPLLNDGANLRPFVLH